MFNIVLFNVESSLKLALCHICFIGYGMKSIAFVIEKFNYENVGLILDGIFKLPSLLIKNKWVFG